MKLLKRSRNAAASRVFVGTHEVAGYYANLLLGLRNIGVQADFVEYQQHKFQYRTHDESFFVLRWIGWFNKHQVRPELGRALRRACAVSGWALQFVYFPYALWRYDVFIFGFGQTILPRNWDLPVLRWFGKRVIAHLGHGSELRPPYIDGAYQSLDGKVQPTLEAIMRLACKNAKRARFFERHVSLIIGAPFSTAHYTSKALINFYVMGVPYRGKSGASPQPVPDGRAQDAGAVSGRKTPVRILHCPSHPALKGSARVRELVAALRAKGHALEYHEITGRPNVEVIAAIETCDFVVDQVYSDTPLSGFATEAAWHGKAVVVGGYGFDILKRHIPERMWPPSLSCHPDDVERAMEDLIVHGSRRLELGRSLQDFVRTQWSAEEVAKRYLALIRGDAIPDDWWIRPEDVVYFHGIGQTEEQTRAKIRALVQAYGVEGLQLSRKPALEKAFLAFAEAGTQRA